MDRRKQITFLLIVLSFVLVGLGLWWWWQEPASVTQAPVKSGTEVTQKAEAGVTPSSSVAKKPPRKVKPTEWDRSKDLRKQYPEVKIPAFLEGKSQAVINGYIRNVVRNRKILQEVDSTPSEVLRENYLSAREKQRAFLTLQREFTEDEFAELQLIDQMIAFETPDNQSTFNEEAPTIDAFTPPPKPIGTSNPPPVRIPNAKKPTSHQLRYDGQYGTLAQGQITSIQSCNFDHQDFFILENGRIRFVNLDQLRARAFAVLCEFWISERLVRMAFLFSHVVVKTQLIESITSEGIMIKAKGYAEEMNTDLYFKDGSTILKYRGRDIVRNDQRVWFQFPPELQSLELVLVRVQEHGGVFIDFDHEQRHSAAEPQRTVQWEIVDR